MTTESDLETRIRTTLQAVASDTELSYQWQPEPPRQPASRRFAPLWVAAAAFVAVVVSVGVAVVVLSRTAPVGPTTEPTVSSNAVDVGAPEWRRVVPHLEVLHDSAIGRGPQIQRIHRDGTGWLAIGEANDRFAVWESTDLVEWTMAFSEPYDEGTDQDRFLSVTGLTVHNDRVIATGNVTLSPWNERPNFGPVTRVWVRDSDGWRRSVGAGSLDEFASIVFGVEATSLGVFAVGEIRPDEPQQGPARPAIWRSDDGDEWVRLEAGDNTFGGEGSVIGLVEFGGGLVAVGSANQEPMVWQSNDGISWTRSRLGEMASYARVIEIGILDGLLAVMAEAWDAERTAPPPVLWLSDDATTWVGPDRDPAFGFGDSGRLAGLEQYEGGLLASALIHERPGPEFCYQDVATCDNFAVALNTTEDGTQWSRLDFHPEPLALIEEVVVDSGHIIVRVEERDPNSSDRFPVLWIWQDEDPPNVSQIAAPTTTAPTYPMYDSDSPLTVGETVRYVFALDGCGSNWFSFDEDWYSPTSRTYQPDEYPEEWPVQRQVADDGPSAVLYGTITRLDSTTIEVHVEDGDLVAVLEPSTEEPRFCG